MSMKLRSLYKRAPPWLRFLLRNASIYTGKPFSYAICRYTDATSVDTQNLSLLLSVLMLCCSTFKWFTGPPKNRPRESYTRQIVIIARLFSVQPFYYPSAARWLTVYTTIDGFHRLLKDQQLDQAPSSPHFSFMFGRYLGVRYRRRPDCIFPPTYQSTSEVFLQSSVTTAFSLSRHSPAFVTKCPDYDRCSSYFPPLFFFFCSSALPTCPFLSIGYPTEADTTHLL